jgi:hypothetical protein
VQRVLSEAQVEHQKMEEAALRAVHAHKVELAKTLTLEAVQFHGVVVALKGAADLIEAIVPDRTPSQT